MQRGHGARSGGRRGPGVLKEPRKGGLGVSLVDAVVEPGGHYCRSSDAAVLLCVRIIAPAAACVVCCGCGVATVAPATARRRETGREKGRRFSGEPLLLPFFLSFCGISGAFLLGSNLQELGQNHAGFSGSCTPSWTKSLCCGFFESGFF